MIFFKKQHEEIAGGFLQRIDVLLRSDNKAVAGYSIDNGVETLKLQIGKSIVQMSIKGQVWADQKKPEIKGPPEDPNLEAAKAADATEIIY